MDRLREGLTRVPDGRLFTIRYDELVVRPLETVKRIYRELDLGEFEVARPLIESFLASTPVRPAPAASLDAELERELRHRWQRQFGWLGYASPPQSA